VSVGGDLRAVLDPNVIVSGMLSRQGTPARILLAWLEGDFELIVSEALLAELERVLAYPKLASRLAPEDAADLLGLLRALATSVDDPPDPPRWVPADPGDDYLVALAAQARAVLVSGDAHVLDLAGRLPVLAPADFWALLAERSGGGGT
jgi:putative PIN family toxin of toxin-antitoxin system